MNSNDEPVVSLRPAAKVYFPRQQQQHQHQQQHVNHDQYQYEQDLTNQRYDTIALPRKLELELNRSSTSDSWQEIPRESVDWSTKLVVYPNAFVVRIKNLLNEGQPEAIISTCMNGLLNAPSKSSSSIALANFLSRGAIDVVCEFEEFSVSMESPLRYSTTILLVFDSINSFDELTFNSAVLPILVPDGKAVDPYVTLETLDAFLCRRAYSAGFQEAPAALGLLERNLAANRPSSSLFLKLSSQNPVECLELVRRMDSSQVCRLLGERSLHKLAVSLTSNSMIDGDDDFIGGGVVDEGHLSLPMDHSTAYRRPSTDMGPFEQAIEILSHGLSTEDWGFVAYNTLMRLAQQDDRMFNTPNQRVTTLISMIESSSLDPLDKMALKLMSGMPITEKDDSRIQRIWRRFLKGDIGDSSMNVEIDFVLNLLGDKGQPSACHLLSVLLRECVDHNRFEAGWSVASATRAISKQVFGEVVHLCSKAFFEAMQTSRQQQQPSTMNGYQIRTSISSNHNNGSGSNSIWYERVQFCVERHLNFLNRYPCGLALHLASHARQFHTCWKWFVAMRQRLAFRLTGYHTSAVLKAASYAQPPAEMSSIVELYDMTLPNERSTFTYIPLIRIWEFSPVDIRAAYAEFWTRIAMDVESEVNMFHQRRHNDTKLDKVYHRLQQWVNMIQRGGPVGASSNRFGRRSMNQNRHHMNQNRVDTSIQSQNSRNEMTTRGGAKWRHSATTVTPYRSSSISSTSSSSYQQKSPYRQQTQQQRSRQDLYEERRSSHFQSYQNHHDAYQQQQQHSINHLGMTNERDSVRKSQPSMWEATRSNQMNANQRHGSLPSLPIVSVASNFDQRFAAQPSSSSSSSAYGDMNRRNSNSNNHISNNNKSNVALGSNPVGGFRRWSLTPSKPPMSEQDTIVADPPRRGSISSARDAAIDTRSTSSRSATNIGVLFPNQSQSNDNPFSGVDEVVRRLSLVDPSKLSEPVASQRDHSPSQQR